MCTMIVHVRGISGSGKSYICSELQRCNAIKCVDTDDYLTHAYNELLINDDDKIIEHATHLLNKDIEKHKILVVVGITLDVENADSCYFIRIPKMDLPDVYRRTIDREILKYKNLTKSKNLKQIEGLNYNDISYFLRYKFHINAINPVDTTFSEYKNMYENALSYEQKKGTIIKSQKQIINDIINMII